MPQTVDNDILDLVVEKIINHIPKIRLLLRYSFISPVPSIGIIQYYSTTKPLKSIITEEFSRDLRMKEIFDQFKVDEFATFTGQEWFDQKE